MGLDMYLYKNEYVSGWDFSKDERFDALQQLLGIPVAKHSPHIQVKVCVAYWRKANAIHGWFVEHVQNGEDECNPYEVSLAKLLELKRACDEVIDMAGASEVFEKVAKQTLPPREGFFFGHYEYDEFYLEDLKETVSQIEAIEENCKPELERVAESLRHNVNVEVEPADLIFFTYQSSW